MFVRFTVLERDPHSHVHRGVFLAAYAILEDVELAGYEREAIEESLGWFRANLAVPRCLKAGRYPRGVCWFRASAAGHVSKAWELVWLLRGRGLRVQMLKAAEPGRVVYADEAQVVAVPRRVGREGAVRRRAVVW